MEWIHLLSLNPIIKDNLASLVCGSLYKEKFAYHDHSDSWNAIYHQNIPFLNKKIKLGKFLY